MQPHKSSTTELTAALFCFCGCWLLFWCVTGEQAAPRHGQGSKVSWLKGNQGGRLQLKVSVVPQHVSVSVRMMGDDDRYLRRLSTNPVAVVHFVLQTKISFPQKNISSASFYATAHNNQCLFEFIFNLVTTKNMTRAQEYIILKAQQTLPDGNRRFLNFYSQFILIQVKQKQLQYIYFWFGLKRLWLEDHSCLILERVLEVKQPSMLISAREAEQKTAHVVFLKPDRRKAHRVVLMVLELHADKHFERVVIFPSTRDFL